ncbi:MAG: CpsD/CapB family tyrosine-protein kinase [Mangrovicoccus sp.]|nr:CpsD/CapB family tyrosine-protein kinase [Mangrovicoccus sp.]
MTASGRASRVIDPSTDEAWQALPQFEPDEKTLRSNRVVAYFGGRDAAAFDVMRTKLIQQIKANGWKRILITSPSPKCGKTTITANLAFSLARQADFRTMVIETDMRRPELAHMLGIKQNLCFARVLAGEEPAEAHMVACGSNLAIGANKVPAENPSELLHSAQARSRIEEIEQRLKPDLVLFDAPPVLASDDTAAFLDFVDAALLVAAAEETSIDEVDLAESEIAASTNVLGVVLNKSRYTSSTYGYEEGYY